MGKAPRRRGQAVPDPARRPAAAPRTDADAAWSSRAGTALAAVLAAAAVFRVAYFLQYRHASVFFDTPFFDSVTYDAWAHRIAAGEWVTTEPFYFAPGYAYALAFVYRFISTAPATVYALQLALGLVDIVCIHHLTALAFGRRAATVAAALAALYAPFPFFETKLLSPTLALTMLLLALVALTGAQRRGGAGRWAVAGGLLGATSLLRPETLVAVPLVALWVHRWAPRPVRGVLWLLVAWAGLIAPAAVHNIRAGGGLTLISSQAAITFFQANNPRANGLYVPLTEEGFSGHPRLQAAEEKAIAEKTLGKPLTRSEVSAYWFGRGLSFIRERPGRFLWLVGMKLVRFLGSYEYSTEYNLQTERELAWLLWLPFVPFGLLVALAAPAIMRALRARREALDATIWLLLLVLLANLFVILVFYVSSRYRLPSVPSLLAFAAATLVALAERVAAGRRTEAYAAAGIVGALFLVLHFEKDGASRFQEANQHFNVATAWAKKAADEKAVVEYRRALRMVDTRPDYWYALAGALRRLGRGTEAADAYGEAARRQPSFFEAHALRALMLEESGDWAGARAGYEAAERLHPDDFEVQLRLGRAAARLGDRAAAIRHLDRALALEPGSEEARAERGRL